MLNESVAALSSHRHHLFSLHNIQISPPDTCVTCQKKTRTSVTNQRNFQSRSSWISLINNTSEMSKEIEAKGTANCRPKFNGFSVHGYIAFHEKKNRLSSGGESVRWNLDIRQQEKISWFPDAGNQIQ